MGDCAKPALRRKKVHHYDEPGHAHFLTFGWVACRHVAQQRVGMFFPPEEAGKDTASLD
jgi:hypothetical protein